MDDDPQDVKLKRLLCRLGRLPRRVVLEYTDLDNVLRRKHGRAVEEWEARSDGYLKFTQGAGRRALFIQPHRYEVAERTREPATGYEIIGKFVSLM